MEKYFTCEEVAELYRVKLSTVWEWVRSGKLRSVKIGRVYRVKQSALDEFEKPAAK